MRKFKFGFIDIENNTAVIYPKNDDDFVWNGFYKDITVEETSTGYSIEATRLHSRLVILNPITDEESLENFFEKDIVPAKSRFFGLIKKPRHVKPGLYNIKRTSNIKIEEKYLTVIYVS